MWAAHRAAQMAEIAQLEQLQRERALTTEESARLEKLLYNEKQRARRLRDQIRATREKLHKLEAMAA